MSTSKQPSSHYSMEAQNGSAYSQPGSASNTTPRTPSPSHTHTRYPSDIPHSTTAVTQSRQKIKTTHHQYDYLKPDNCFPAPQQLAHYYSTHHASSYPATGYEQELHIADDHPISYSQHPSSSSAKAYASQYTQQRFPTSHGSKPSREQNFSPSTRRWSIEYSPEERLRLGLRRWESEEDRDAYEQAQGQRRKS